MSETKVHILMHRVALIQPIPIGLNRVFFSPPWYQCCVQVVPKVLKHVTE